MDEDRKLKISLIIPAYNEEKYLGECLQSIINNHDGYFHEIIVVNNRSTDQTRAVAEKFPEVIVVDEDRPGPTMARQRGYQTATGDILAYVDADTRLPKGWSEHIHREFCTNDDLACLSGPYIYHDIPWWQSLAVKIWYWLAMPLYWLAGFMATAGNFAIRRKVLDQMQGFDQSIRFYGDDTNLARRAKEFGRVKFKLSFVMPTSGRRFAGQGYFRTGWLYLINFLAEAILKRPVTKEHIDIR